MAITPDEIENRVFSLVRRGYDPNEVDDFLKEVAATLAHAQGGLATPPARPPAPDTLSVHGADDFERLGEEVAAILRQAHESVATLRHRAEAEAALIRQDAQREATDRQAEADADRQAAAIELEAARAEAELILSDVRNEADRMTESAVALTRQRTVKIIESARRQAHDAVAVQRSVRGRLEGTRDDIDQALDRLIEEDTDIFGTIDLTDAGASVAGDEGPGDDVVSLPGQGPPTPPVPPPTRTTPTNIDDLPYASDDDDPPVVDLTGDDVQPVGGEMGAGLPDQPGPDAGGGEGGAPDASSGGGDDPLAQMVKSAVENALKRRKGDEEAPGDGGI